MLSDEHNKEKLTSITATKQCKNIAKEVSALRDQPVYVIVEELLIKERERLKELEGNIIPLESFLSSEVENGTIEETEQ